MSRNPDDRFNERIAVNSTQSRAPAIPSPRGTPDHLEVVCVHHQNGGLIRSHLHGPCKEKRTLSHYHVWLSEDTPQQLVFLRAAGSKPVAPRQTDCEAPV